MFRAQASKGNVTADVKTAGVAVKKARLAATIYAGHVPRAAQRFRLAPRKIYNAWRVADTADTNIEVMAKGEAASGRRNT